MASTQTRPTRQLRELLQEEQEPFVLETYLNERGYSKTSSKPELGSSKVSKKPGCVHLQRIKKGLLYSSKLLKSMYKNLVRAKKSSKIENCDEKDGEEANVPAISTSLQGQDQEQVQEQASFSASSSSTRSCDQVRAFSLYSSSSSREEEAEITTEVQEKQEEEDIDDSILTASLFGSLVCSTTRKPGRVQVRELQDLVHCKTMVMQSQQLMLDCVRELIDSVNGGRKKNGGEFLGSEEIGKLVLEKMKDWGKRSGEKKKNMGMEFQDLVHDFRPQKSEIVAAIGDEILEELKNQLVIDLLCE